MRAEGALEETIMYQNILVPIDGSDTAALGLSEAIELARALRGRIRLLHVVNTVTWVGDNVAPSILEELINQARSFGECVIHDAKTTVRSADVEVDSRIIEAFGDAAGEAVIAEANSWPAQLIVCGTHGRRGLKRLLLGSDAEYIVRHAPVPVLLIRARGP
jgi:nucleotide-binding universal stress UspA family protein